VGPGRFRLPNGFSYVLASNESYSCALLVVLGQVNFEMAFD